MTSSSYTSPGTNRYEGGAGRTDIGFVRRSAEHRAKLVKFFQFRLEAHAHGVAVREYAEDRRFVRDRIKRLTQERDQLGEYIRSHPDDRSFSRLGSLDADIEELNIELDLIGEAIDARQALVDPIRRLLGPMRDLLRKTRMDIRVSRSGSTESDRVTSVPVYADARAAD